MNVSPLAIHNTSHPPQCSISLLSGISSSIFNTNDFPVFIHEHISRFCPIHIYRIVSFLMDFLYLRTIPSLFFISFPRHLVCPSFSTFPALSCFPVFSRTRQSITSSKSFPFSLFSFSPSLRAPSSFPVFLSISVDRSVRGVQTHQRVLHPLRRYRVHLHRFHIEWRCIHCTKMALLST